MKTIERKKILTKDEETTLFKALHDEKTPDAERKRVEETLVLKNMGLVLKEARRYATNGSIPLEDLVQEGALGLVRAIHKFDPALDKKFSTYATFWIKRDVGRFIRTSSDVIHVPEHTSETARIAKAAIAKFELENGRLPTRAEFEKISGISPEKADEAFRAVQKTASIHTSVGDDGDSELGDMIEDQNAESPRTGVMRDEGDRILNAVFAMLTLTERVLLFVRYGVTRRAMTVAEVAAAFGIPESELSD